MENEPRLQTDLEKALEDELSISRLLVFLEDDDGFRQVLLTLEEYKKLGDIFVDGKYPDGGDHGTFRLRLDRVLPKEPFDGLEAHTEHGTD